MRTEIRFAGVGGQGLVSASIILAEALGVVRGYEVIQTQFYASSISGGASAGDVVASDSKIIFPWVLEPDVMVAMAQDAVNAHADAMKPGSKIIVDDIFVTDVTLIPKEVEIFWAPLTQLADEAGFRKCANIVALGAFAGQTGLLDLDQIGQAVAARAPGKAEVNQKALRSGYGLKLKPIHN